MADPDSIHFLGVARFHLGFELIIGNLRSEAICKRALFDRPGNRFSRAVEGQHVVRAGWVGLGPLRARRLGVGDGLRWSGSRGCWSGIALSVEGRLDPLRHTLP